MKMSVRRSELMRIKSFEPSLSMSVMNTQVCKSRHAVGGVDRLNCDETKLLDFGHVEVYFEVVLLVRGLTHTLKDEIRSTISIDI